jgi:hypothetical protein
MKSPASSEAWNQWDAMLCVGVWLNGVNGAGEEETALYVLGSGVPLQHFPVCVDAPEIVKTEMIFYRRTQSSQRFRLIKLPDF